jgi:membrane protein DedA with SNARE-associated domain
VEAFVERLLDDVAAAGSGWLLFAAFLLAFGETAFLLDLLVPGEVGLVFVGAAAARGGVSLAAMIAVATIGATLGDSAGWVLGRYGAAQVIQRWEWTRRRFGRKLDRARAYFEHRGGAAVFFGRFIGAIRAVVSVVAGMGSMSYWRFLGWNVAASLVWTGSVVSAGYFLGRHADSLIADVGLFLSLAVALVALLWWLARRSRNLGGP